KLILLAPAFEFSIKYIGLTPLISRFRRVIPQNRPLSAFDMQSPARKALQPDYWADVMVAPAAELMRLNRLCRRNLKRLKSHTLLILGECDQTIPTHVAEYIRLAAPQAASFETYIIEDASHLFPFNEHAPEMVRVVQKWMASQQ
ncbi:MAG: alpha/beta fold hydrolase, partial [Candidatus Hydrogenedentales bacterium]